MRMFRYLGSLLALLAVGSIANAGFEFNIVPSSNTYVSDGVTPVSGYFDVVLNLTGADLLNPPTDIGSFNFAYTAPSALGISSVTNLGTGVGGGLLNGQVFDSTTYPNATNLLYAKDSLGTPFVAFQGAKLARFNFTTSATTNTYNITAGNSIFQQLGTSGGGVLGPLTVNGGTINVTAVPEPSSLAFAAIAGTAFAVRRFRKGRKKLATA